MSMNAQLGLTTANRDVQTLLAPSLAPVTTGSHWGQMGDLALKIPRSLSAVGDSLLQVAASRLQDGPQVTQKKISSVNGLSTSQTMAALLSSELTHRLSGLTEGILVLLTIWSSLMELETMPTPWTRSVVTSISMTFPSQSSLLDLRQELYSLVPAAFVQPVELESKLTTEQYPHRHQQYQQVCKLCVSSKSQVFIFLCLQLLTNALRTTEDVARSVRILQIPLDAAATVAILLRKME